MKKPPKPPTPKKAVTKPAKPRIDPFARALAQNVRDGHGTDQASTLDMSESIGSPRGFVATRNIALDRALRAQIPLGRVTEISGWPGAGKCEAVGSLTLMANGHRKLIETIKPGEYVATPTGPNQVISVTRGTGPMFRVIPNRGEPWECNAEHVLTVSYRGKIIDVPIKEYFAFSDDKQSRCRQVMTSHPVKFTGGPVLPVNPYFLGVWYRDGTKDFNAAYDRLRHVQITNGDTDVIGPMLAAVAQDWRLSVTQLAVAGAIRYSIVGSRGRLNDLLEAMRRVVGRGPKYGIADALCRGSITTRRAFLAGMIDADGSADKRAIEITQKHLRVAGDLTFIARSLGIRVTQTIKYVDGVPYHRMYMSGTALNQLPIRIARKRVHARVGTAVGFRVIGMGDGEYAGFQLATPGRYYRGDFTITHNSTMLDQILAQCQAEGGIAVLADTERTRNRKYMTTLDVDPASLVWIGGGTVELMFDEIETIARSAAHLNCIAWVEALNRAGVKCPMPKLYKHCVYGEKDGRGKRKTVAEFSMTKWGREQSASLLEYQQANDMEPTGIRTPESRAALNPIVLYGSEADKREALEAFLTGEETEHAHAADRPIVIGWDSVAGTATEAEMAGDARDQHPATAARVIKRNLRRLVQLIDDEAIAFVLVNQRYEKIAMGRNFTAGSETYGGSGIKYHTTIRIEVDKIGEIFEKSSDKANKVPPIGQIVRITIPKNKLAEPYRKEEYGLIFGRGAENAWAIYQDLRTRGIIRQGGAWSKFTDSTIMGPANRSFRGWQDMANMMAEDPVLWQRLRDLYMEGA